VIGQIGVSSCILYAEGRGKAGRTSDEPVIGRYLMEMSPKYGAEFSVTTPDHLVTK
jgi:hypothetical protein